MRSYRPEELFEPDGAPVPLVRNLSPARRPADERHPARQRRPAVAGPLAARLPRLRRRGRTPRHRRDLGDRHARPVPPRRDGEQRGRTQLPGLRPGREQLQPAAGHPRGHRPRLDGAGAADRRAPGRGRAGDGDPLRAHLPGLAGGLPADRPARVLQLLRGLHPHRRLDGQPARQVAEDHPAAALATPDRLAELPAHLARVAPGPQRVQPPGPRLHRPRREQEGRRDPRLPAAGRQHPALGGGPLPAQPGLHQRDRGREAAGAAVPVDGRRRRALHQGHRDLGVGQHRRRDRRPTW